MAAGRHGLLGLQKVPVPFSALAEGDSTAIRESPKPTDVALAGTELLGGDRHRGGMRWQPAEGHRFFGALDTGAVFDRAWKARSLKPRRK